MQENALKQLYVDELRDIYNGEEQLVKAFAQNGESITFP